jgi:uncharacterized membrane protein YdbT with pleckstrin-like domain
MFMPETIKKYHPLGSYTLFMFIFKKSAILFLLVAILIASLVFLGYVPAEYVDMAANALIGYFVVVLVAFVVVFLVGWLQYVRYWIFVDDKDLKIARGLISTEQIGIPYKRIQDVKIERTIVDQIFGVADIVITVGGDDDSPEASTSSENTVILPSVSHSIALEIQDIVLKKAQVDQVHVVSAQNRL